MDAPEPFQISTDDVDGRTVLKVSGELDMATAPELEGQLRTVVCAERETVLDLSEVSFMDSTGLALLVGAVNRAKTNGWNLELVSPQGPARRVIEITGTAPVLGFSDPDS